MTSGGADPQPRVEMSGGRRVGLDRCSPRWPTAASPVVAVIGDPVAHSLSPRLHQAAFDAWGLDWVSVGFLVPSGQAAAAVAGVRALGLRGVSVTMPHKAAAAAAVDVLTPVARRLRAVNCIIRRHDQLVGDSTDGEGFVQALASQAGFDPAGRVCAVVGAGGAARAVVLALAEAGARRVLVVNRTRRRAEQAAALAGPAGEAAGPAAVADAELVVNATPLGMASTGRQPAGSQPADQLPVAADRLGSGQVVADLVYQPAITPLLAAAAQAGAITVGGLGMLVHQAALALTSWTGQPAPLDAMWAAATS